MLSCCGSLAICTVLSPALLTLYGADTPGAVALLTLGVDAAAVYLARWCLEPDLAAEACGLTRTLSQTLTLSLTLTQPSLAADAIVSAVTSGENSWLNWLFTILNVESKNSHDVMSMIIVIWSPTGSHFDRAHLLIEIAWIGVNRHSWA